MSVHRRIGTLIGLALIIGFASTAAILRAGDDRIPLQTHDFTDVPVVNKEFMEPFINAFYHQGITTGCKQSPLEYCPETNVTRGEMAVFMGRALGYREMELDGYNAKAYFDQITPGEYHGVVAKSIDGYALYGISANSVAVLGESYNFVGVMGSSDTIGVWGVGNNSGTGVVGQSIDGTGVFAGSNNATALAASGAGNVATDTIYDIRLDGTLGELFGTALHLFSNGDINLSLDKDNNSANMFSIYNGAGTLIMTVNESGTLHVTGDLEADGVKPATVETQTHGKRAMYAVESTEVWFEDFGTAQLVDGVAVIEIDPMFAETVNLDVEYHIYTEPIGGWAELYIAEQTATSFTVRAANRNADIRFHYRIVAKRLGYEDVRMEEEGG